MPTDREAFDFFQGRIKDFPVKYETYLSWGYISKRPYLAVMAAIRSLPTGIDEQHLIDMAYPLIQIISGRPENEFGIVLCSLLEADGRCVSDYIVNAVKQLYKLQGKTSSSSDALVEMIRDYEIILSSESDISIIKILVRATIHAL